jgi:hypothetical protein
MKRPFLRFTALLTAVMLLCQSAVVLAQTAPAPPSVSYPVVTEQSVYDTWELFYETLFTSPYDVNTTKLNLSSTVTDPGLYAGTNQNSEAFQLDVLSVVELNPSELNLLPAVLIEMLRQNVTWSIVEVVASTSVGSLSVSGMALSRHNATIPYESVFIPLAEITTTYSAMADGAGVPFPICVPVPVYCTDPGCLEDCLDDYNDSVAAANAAAELAEANEQVQHQTNMTQLSNTLNGALDLADANYDTQIKTCAAIGVGGALLSVGAAFLTLGIGAGLLVATATALAACQLNAGNTRDIAKNTAQSNYNTGVANENARHEGELQMIANTLQSELDAAAAALAECQGDCPTIICGWYFICFWVYPY